MDFQEQLQIESQQLFDPFFHFAIKTSWMTKARGQTWLISWFLATVGVVCLLDRQPQSSDQQHSFQQSFAHFVSQNANGIDHLEALSPNKCQEQGGAGPACVGRSPTLNSIWKHCVARLTDQMAVTLQCEKDASREEPMWPGTL